MKKLILMILACFLISGCAVSKLTTDAGTSIGETYQEAAAEGIISAEQSIEIWPYISGQIKGLMAADYDIDVPPLATQIVDKLDKIAAKDEITMEEKGIVIGSFVRLEKLAIEYAWDKYGFSVFRIAVGGI